jgi:hypothetical protein
LRRLAPVTGIGSGRRLQLIVVELPAFDRRRLRAFELVWILIVVEADQAPLLTYALERRVRLDHVVFLGIPLDDGDLVVPLITVGNRRRECGRGGEKSCNQDSRADPMGDHDWLPGHEAETRYFFFLADFFAAFFAGFFAALAFIVVRPSVDDPQSCRV